MERYQKIYIHICKLFKLVPNKILTTEKIGILVFNPQNYQNNIYSKVSVFSWSSIIKDDLSVIRVSYTSMNEIEIIKGPKLERKPETKMDGIYIATCEQIESIADADGIANLFSV